jgi:hypothetical protein
MAAAHELTLERIAKNQSTFREANEKIDAIAEQTGLEEAIPFICECADLDCMEIVRLRLDEYAVIRSNARRFFNAPGHEAISVNVGAGVVVEEHPGHVVVEKTGIAGELAEREA